MLYGALCMLCNSGDEDVLQPLIHLTHPIGVGCGQHIQKRGHSGHILAGPSEGGELPLHMVNCHGLAYLKHGFTLVQCGFNDRPLISELAPSLCGFAFDVIL
jgi:hypothetical protein